MEIEIKLADYSHKRALIELWIETFGDSEEFVTKFIESYMISEYNVPVVIMDGRVVSAFYLIDFDLYSNCERTGVCSYLFAAATKSEYRSRGYMSKLIKYALELYRNRGIKAVFLFPQNQNTQLFSYYEKLGFRTIYYAKKISEFAYVNYVNDEINTDFTNLELQECDITDTEIFDDLYKSYLEFSAKQNLSPIKDRLFYFKCARSYLESEDRTAKFAVFKNNTEIFCYVFYKKSKNAHYIDDIIYSKGNTPTNSYEVSQDRINKILALLTGYIKKQNCVCEINIQPTAFSDKKNIPLAMILPLDKETERITGTLKRPVYLNMFMNL